MLNFNDVKSSLPDRSRYCSPAADSNNNLDSADIIVSNICDSTNEQRAYIVHAVLSTVLLSIERNDIANTPASA